MLKSAGEKDLAGPRVPELFTVAFTVARWELFSCCVVKLEFGSNRRSSVSVMLSGTGHCKVLRPCKGWGSA